MSFKVEQCLAFQGVDVSTVLYDELIVQGYDSGGESFVQDILTSRDIFRGR